MTTEETSPSNDQVESSSPTEKACDEEWRKYRSNFPSISYMTSKELVQQEDKVMLVDVRTDAEQKVSMIPNSMTFEEWKQNELPKLIQADADDSSKKADSNKIVFYCTIGYRSGVEAKKFQDAYPDLKFYSLDGIVPYTQLGLPLVERNQTNKEEQPKETNRVHVFGPAWSKFANPEFDVVIFSKTKFLMEGIAVKFKQFFGGTK